MARLSAHTRREGFVIERLAMFIGVEGKCFVLVWHSTPVALASRSMKTSAIASKIVDLIPL